MRGLRSVAHGNPWLKPGATCCRRSAARKLRQRTDYRSAKHYPLTTLKRWFVRRSWDAIEAAGFHWESVSTRRRGKAWSPRAKRHAEAVECRPGCAVIRRCATPNLALRVTIAQTAFPRLRFGLRSPRLLKTENRTLKAHSPILCPIRSFADTIASAIGQGMASCGSSQAMVRSCSGYQRSVHL